MDDKEIYALQSVDQSVICEVYFNVVSGKLVQDEMISNIVVYMHQQLQCWKDLQDVTFCLKDNILLCLSTLLLVVKKKLCATAALLDVIKDADSTIIVSIVLKNNKNNNYVY